jgi:mTERF
MIKVTLDDVVVGSPASRSVTNICDVLKFDNGSDHDEWKTMKRAWPTLCLSALSFIQACRCSAALVGVRPSCGYSSTTALFAASYSRRTNAPSSVVADHPASISRGSSRVNAPVRSVMDLLIERYGNHAVQQDLPAQDTAFDTSEVKKSLPLGNWTKMRRFLYRTCAAKRDGALTVRQVVNVLDFLNQTFPDNLPLQQSILMQSPRILSKHVSTRLLPTAEFLRSLYGAAAMKDAVMRNPDLLLTTGTGYNGDALDLVDVFLRQDLHLTTNNVRHLKKTCPGLFQLSMVQLLSVVSYLRSILQVPDTDPQIATPESSPTLHATATIGKLILAHPSIFQLSVPDNLRPRIQYLQDRLALSDADLACLTRSCSGAILGLSVTRNIQPTLELLSSILPSSSDLRKALLSHPQILGLSLPNLRAKIEYFNRIDEMARGSGSCSAEDRGGISLASRFLMRSPTIFSLSLRDNILPTVEFLGRIWGAATPSDPSVDDCAEVSVTLTPIAPLLFEYPSILTLSLEGNIQPTVNFYVRAGYLSLNDDGRLDTSHGREMIVRGRYIASSLFTRLLPRWNYYCEQKQEKNGELFVPPPLHVLAGTTDDVFCEKCGLQLDLYTLFKETAIPRLKFSSQFDTWLHTGRPIDV